MIKRIRNGRKLEVHDICDTCGEDMTAKGIRGVTDTRGVAFCNDECNGWWRTLVGVVRAVRA